jgi:hypothetical protein
MRRLLIAFARPSKKVEAYLREGMPDDDPESIPFGIGGLPIARGDRVLSVVGGRVPAYVAWETAASGWKTGRSGAWKNWEYFQVNQRHVLKEYVSAQDVFRATGFKPPHKSCEVPAELAPKVWRVARQRPLDVTDHAIEGAATETRSRFRNPRLRELALIRAAGKCEGCGRNFHEYANGLGRRCLVVHHKNQLSDTDQPVETAVSQLAVVCANCHMIIHTDSQRAMSLTELRRRLSRN